MKKFLLMLTASLLALTNSFGAATWWLQEDFESGQIPAGWTQEVVSTNVGNWAVEATTAATYPATGNESNYYVALRNTTGEDQHYVTKLVSPVISFTTDVFQPRLIFRHAQVGATQYFDTLKVYYRQNAEAAWIQLKAYETRTDNWTLDTIALSGYAGATAYQVAFECVENMGRGIVLDDIGIVNASQCVAPSQVSATEVGTTSVTLTWAGDLMADTFEVVLTKTAVTDWDNYIAAYHNFVVDNYSVDITELDHSTNYFAYVRSQCNDNDAGWTDWATGTFRTMARAEVPYTELFSTALPEGWLSATDMTTARPTFPTSTLSSYSVDSTNAMVFSAVTAGKYACAVTPEINVPSLQGVELGFWGYAGTYIRTPHNTYIAQMYIGVMDNPYDSSSLVIVDSVEITVANKHQHFSISLENYTGTGKYVAFIVSNPTRSSYFYVDYLTITQPSVFTPTDVRITNATPDGFDVTVNKHNAQTWNLRVAESGNYSHLNALPSTFLVSQDGISSDTYHVTGEFGDMVVCVYAQGVSGGNASEWSFPTTLLIPGRATLPLAYEFDQTADASVLLKSLDNEIHAASTVKTFPGLYFPLSDFVNFYPKSSTAAPSYYGGHMLLQGFNRWVALPYVDSFAGQMVSFRLAAASAGQSRVAVGIMHDAYDLSTFTQLAVFDGPAGSYRKCEVELDGLDSLGHYVAIVSLEPAKPATTYGTVNHIDALHIETVPTCREAADVVGHDSGTVLNLTWSSLGMSQWLVELFAGTNADSLIEAKTVSEPAATFTGLTTQTSYYYRVSTLCGQDTLFGENKVLFTTECVPTALPWSEGFEDYSTGSYSSQPLDCWSVLNVNAGTSTSYPQAYVSNTASYVKSGDKSMYLKASNAGYGYLIIPKFTDPLNTLMLSFSHREGSNTAAYGYIDVGYMTDKTDEATFVSLAHYDHMAAWQDEELYLSAIPAEVASTAYLVFRYGGGTGNGYVLAIDDILVEVMPTCKKVQSLIVSDVTASTANVAWTPIGDETQWQYVLTVPGQSIDWSNAATVSSPAVALTGLNGSSSYNIHVRAYCSDNEQSNAATATFTTDCGTIASMPWGESFEAFEVGTYSSPNVTCWSLLNANDGTSSTYPQVYINNSATYVKTGVKSLYFKSSKSRYAYAIFPAISVPLNTLRIAFSHREENATNSAYLAIGYMTDPSDSTSFVALKQFERLNAWQDEEFVLSSIPSSVASTARLAFRYGGGTQSNNYYVGIDDIVLSTVDFSCPGLTTLEAVAASGSAIQISWASELNLPVDVEVSDTASFDNALTFSAVETLPFVIDSLLDNHTYYVRARQTCDSEGEWKTATVKTLCAAVAPDDFPVQTFENTGDLDCWQVGVNIPGKQTTANPTITSLAARGKYLYFNKTATTSDTITRGDGLYAIMQKLDIDTITKCEVTFKAFKTSTVATNAGKLTIGVITDPADFATFTSIRSFDLEYAADSASEKEYTVNFLNYEGDYNGDYGKYITFYAQSNDAANAIGVDNVDVHMLSACPQVGEGVISDIESTGAKFSWDGTGAESYVVALMLQRGNPDVLADVAPAFIDTVSVDSLLITGLHPATSYYAYIRALCGDEQSNWSTYTYFRTACGTETIPYVQNFDNTDVLDCFTVGNMQNSSSTYTPSLVTTSTYLYDGPCALKIYGCASASTNADSAYVILPMIDFGTKGLSGHTLALQARSYGSTSSYYKHLQVGVVTDEDMSTFQLVEDLTLSDTYELYEIVFSNYTGTGNRIALLTTVTPYLASTTGYSYVYADAINVFATPTCRPLADISTTATRRSIDVQLVPKAGAVADHYELVYADTQPDVAALDTADKIAVDTTGHYTISGLNRETTYYLYARSYCSEEEGTSEWISTSVTTKSLTACDDIKSVGEGTSYTYGPICGYYGYERNGYIFTPSDNLTAGRIGSLAWNYNTAAAKPIPVKIYLKNTTATAFVSTLVWNQIIADATLVYDGTVNVAAGWNLFEITPFEYTGDNLMILVQSDVTGSGGASAQAYYTTSTGTNASNHFYIRKDSSIDDNNTYDSFTTKGINGQRHDVQFGYCYNLDACPAVTSLDAELLGAGIREAMLRWTISDADYLSGFDVIVSDSVVLAPDSVVPTYANVQSDSLSVDILRPETTYHIYVRAICQADSVDEGTSTWVETTITTLANCPAVVNLTGELSTSATTVKVSWMPALEDQELAFAYVYSTDTLDAAALEAATKTYVNDTLAFEISQLANDQTYYIYVAAVCGNSLSPWSRTVIKTDASCAPVRNLTASRVEHNRVVLSWNPSRFGTETQWVAGVVGDTASQVTVTDTADVVSVMLIGLQPDSAYTAYVYAICSDGEMSEQKTLAFTTNSLPSSCTTIGTGTTHSNIVPFNNFYKNAWTQMIYTADEINSSGAIASIWYECAAVATTALSQHVKIYMASTTMSEAATTSDWVPQSDLTLVYENADFVHPTQTGWIEIPLQTPFMYDGSSNLAIVFSTQSTTYATALHYSYSVGNSGVSMYRRSDSATDNAEYPTGTGTRSTYKANIQICIPTDADCMPVTALNVRDITTTTAVASWEPMGAERTWEVYVADTLITDFTGLNSDTVYNYTYPISGLQPDKDYRIYVRPVCGGDWKALAFTTLPTCSAPIDLAVEETTPESATLSWNDAFSVGSAYVVTYGPSITFDLTDSTTYQTVRVNTPRVILTDLNEVTHYTFVVQAVCDEGVLSRYSEAATFETKCVTKTLPWFDGFDGDNYACWRVGNLQSSTGTYIPSLVTSGTYLYDGIRSMHLYAYKSSTADADSAFVMFPMIDFDTIGLQGTTLKLYASNYNTTSAYYYKHMKVGVISGNSMSTFELVADVELSNYYEPYEISFANYTGDGDRIVLLAAVDPTSTSSYQYCNFYVDNIEIYPTPTCPHPTNVTLLSTAADSASFTWTPGADESQWQYICVPDGVSPDWTNAELTDTTTVTVHGLTSGSTTYAFYVRAYCSADDQSESCTAYVTTDCDTITQLPWREGFETYEAGTYSATAITYVPACWDMVKSSGATNYPHVAASGSYAYPHSGTQVLVTYTTDSCIAILPPFATALNELQITFYYRTYNATSCGDLQLGYISTADTAFHAIRTYSPTATYTRVKALLSDLPETAGRLAFLYTGGSSAAYNVNIDDITVETLNLNCAGIENVVVSNTTLNSATIGWNYVGTGSINAEVQVATDANFATIADSATVTGDSLYVSSGLQAATMYYVRVRQLCDDDDTSEWSESAIFYTSYGVPFIPQFNSISIPGDWSRSNTTASQVFAGEAMAAYTAGWSIVAPDTVINAYHMRGNIYGTAWHNWIVSPSIDLTPNAGEGLLLSIDAALVEYSAAKLDSLYAGSDDRFLIAVSEDGGQTWNAANVVEWNNAGTGDYVYNEVPKHGTTYQINMTDYAGKVVKIGFYGESTKTNADNNFHFGKIRLETTESVTYSDTICEGYSFSDHGFNVSYEDLHIGLNTFSHFGLNADSVMQLTIQYVIVNAVSVNELSVTLCEGEHFNDYGFDFTATTSETRRRRLDGGNACGCDSTILLHVTVLPTVREELHVGCNDDSYTWHGKTYYQSTIVSDTLAAVTGCDSIVTLYLTMCDAEQYSYYGAFCTGSSYSDEFFSGLTTAGEYDGVVTNDIGCETRAHLTLRELASGEAYIDSVLVADLPYVLGNDTLCPETDQAGYVYHGSKDFGCGMVNVTIYVVETKDALGNINASELSIAPNPVRIGEDIRILTAVDMSADYSCRIYDAVGKLVYTSDVPSQTIPGLPVAGAYTVRISSGSALYQGKLIVK